MVIKIISVYNTTVMSDDILCVWRGI